MRATTTTSSSSSSALLALLAAGGALARTDLAGCVSSATVAYGGASLVWYVPGTGELCEFLDCGGGRAPPKTTVPGCAAYSGTATYSPNYLPGYGPDATPTAGASSSSSAAAYASPSVTAAPSMLSAAASSSAADMMPSSSSAAEGADGDMSSSSSAMMSSAMASYAASSMAAVTTPHGVMTPVAGTPTAAATPSMYTGAAGKIEAAAGVAVGGVVAALAWL